MTDTNASAGKKAGMAGITFVVYAIYFILPDFGYISAALNNISIACNVDPGVASYMMSVPSFVQIFTGLLCAVILGRYVKSKTLLIIGTALIVVFGAAPVVCAPTTPFVLLLVFRGLLGAGIGLLQPTINAALSLLFADEEQRSRVFGRAGSLYSIGSLAGILLGGFLASVAWNASFYLYLIGIVPFIAVIAFYKEPDWSKNVQEEKEKVKIPALGWFFAFMFGVSMIAFNPVLSLLSSTLANIGITDAGTAGMFTAIILLTGTIGTLFFGKLYGAAKKWTLGVLCLLLFLGQACLFLGLNLAPSVAVVIIGLVCIGVGQLGLNVGTPYVLGLTVSPAVVGAAMSASMVIQGAGSAISSPYIQLVTGLMHTSDYSVVFGVSAIIMLLATIAYFVVAAKQKVVNPVEIDK